MRQSVISRKYTSLPHRPRGFPILARVVKGVTAESSHPVSEAKLKANRANGRMGTGPKSVAGKLRSRSNALRHGLTARVVWPGQDIARYEAFFCCAWERLGPMNPLEETCVADLLQTRLREDHFLEAERVLLMRRPPLCRADQDRPYTFLSDEHALHSLQHFTRYCASLARRFEKEVKALLRVRRENWGRQMEPVGGVPVEQSQAASPAVPVPERGEGTAPPVGLGTLEDCLTDSRLILPYEDADAYQALARGLWTTLAPTNLLEGFLVSDFIQAQWRSDRALDLLTALMEANAISATGHNQGYGFALLHDAQRSQGTESLNLYETALCKRREGRLALLRLVREEHWEDAGPPDPPTKASSVSAPLTAASQPASNQLEPNP